jgi:hypothetical protein
MAASGRREVVGEASAAGQQSQIFDTRDRLADAAVTLRRAFLDHCRAPRQRRGSRGWGVLARAAFVSAAPRKYSEIPNDRQQDRGRGGRGRPIEKTRKIIRGGRVLDAARRRAEAADILIDDDTIAAIGWIGLAPEHAIEIDARDRLLMPGLVNAHTHGHGNLSKALGDRWTLELMHNSLAAMTGRRLPEDKYLAAKIGAVEMIRKGCTAAYDLPFEFPGPTAEGIEARGPSYRSRCGACGPSPSCRRRSRAARPPRWS